MDRSIDPPGAADGVAIGVGDGEATGDGEGEGLVAGLDVSTAVGVLRAWPVDVGVLPHAATNITATIATKRTTRFVIAIGKV